MIEDGATIDPALPGGAPLSFAIRHAAAAVAVVGAILGLAVLSYFGLLVWAVLSGSAVGGPLALPFALLAGVALGVLTVAGVLLPVTAASEFLRRRFAPSHWLAEIPIATLLLFAYLLPLCAGVYAWQGSSIRDGLVRGGVLALVLCAPLGIYWWSLQVASWLWEGVAKAWVWLKSGLQRAVNSSELLPPPGNRPRT